MDRCFCEEETTQLKVEGDVGAEPIWCDVCGANLELSDIPISQELKTSLAKWAYAYGEWIDWDKDKLLPDGVKLEDVHNKQGEKLTVYIKQQLQGKYTVRFSVSTMARRYRSQERE